MHSSDSCAGPNSDCEQPGGDDQSGEAGSGGHLRRKERLRSQILGVSRLEDAEGGIASKLDDVPGKPRIHCQALGNGEGARDMAVRSHPPHLVIFSTNLPRLMLRWVASSSAPSSPCAAKRISVILLKPLMSMKSAAQSNLGPEPQRCCSVAPGSHGRQVRATRRERGCRGLAGSHGAVEPIVEAVYLDGLEWTLVGHGHGLRVCHPASAQRPLAGGEGALDGMLHQPEGVGGGGVTGLGCGEGDARATRLGTAVPVRREPGQHLQALDRPLPRVLRRAELQLHCGQFGPEERRIHDSRNARQARG